MGLANWALLISGVALGYYAGTHVMRTGRPW